MGNERKIIFGITEARDDGEYVIDVRPTLKNIYRAEGGEQIILAVAANCVRTIAKRDGLERAMERFHDLVINHSKVIRR